MIENNLIKKIISGDDSDPKVRIAKAAIGEFAMRSIDGARTREIAQKADTNLASISYYFGGKEGLYKTVIAEMADYFDDAVSPFYKKGSKINDAKDADFAMNLARDFLIQSIKKFSEVQVVPSLCLIMAREEASPSEAFKRVYESIYQRPVEFLSKLLTVATKGKLARDMGLVFSQALWSNVRAYSSKNDAVMKLHGWKKFGETELNIIETALQRVLEKTLK